MSRGQCRDVIMSIDMRWTVGSLLPNTGGVWKGYFWHRVVFSLDPKNAEVCSLFSNNFSLKCVSKHFSYWRIVGKFRKINMRRPVWNRCIDTASFIGLPDDSFYLLDLHETRELLNAETEVQSTAVHPVTIRHVHMHSDDRKCHMWCSRTISIIQLQSNCRRFIINSGFH